MKNTLFILCLCCLMTACGEKPAINVADLRCELLVDPEGIDCPAPRLSWEITSNGRGIRQTAYQILVASTPENLSAGIGDLWDSQKVKSDASVNVAYAGKKLESRAGYYWKVKVTTNKGAAEWSAPARWSMGLLHTSDWQAKWTGLDRSFAWDDPQTYHSRLSARYFRKEFEAPKDIAKATLYISGLGLYKLYVNGTLIGDQELSPTPTDYSKTVKYNTFDVTNRIKKGANAVGTILGNGRFFSLRYDPKDSFTRNFGFPKMLLQLEIEYADGSKQTVASDDSWKVTADGPIRANNEFDGEEYDALKEMPGWNAPGFDDGKWLQAEAVQAPEGRLEAQLNPNIKVMETVKPTNITELKKGTYIMDLGQNMVGTVRLKVKGKKGDKVTMRFAETLNPDGTLYMANLRKALVSDIYTLKGDAAGEAWEPCFVYHGFRFVEITGFPGTPTVNDFEGLVLYDRMDVIGQFETSDKTINQIYKNAYWGIRGNYRGMPTDCPQRDERMGWLGDRAVGAHGESFIFDNVRLYAKWLDDIADAQLENGSIPNVAPNFWRVYSDNMTWPGAYLIIANMLYEQFGTSEPIIKHYASMKKWMQYMRDTYMKDNIMPKDKYGDWCMPPESPELIHSQDPARKTSAAVLGTTFYYRMLFLLERFAGLAGKPDEAKTFAAEAAVIKKAYNDKFFNKETAQYDNNTVTANLLSLCYGMVPEGYEPKVFQNIVDKTMNDFNGHVSTGLVGIQWLMRGLSDYGRADIAYRIVTNRDYPSWGYMIENGATTIWELWNGNTANPAMNSHNHVMLLGDLIVWFYEYLGGIQNAPGSNGFKQIVMKPYPVDGLDYVTASYKSVRGPIKSTWRKTADAFRWEISVPCNAKATVYVPASAANKVMESGKKASSAAGVKYLKQDGAYAVFEVGSGDYSFTVTK